MALHPYQGYLPKIDSTAYISPLAAVIGQVEIGADSSVWPFVSIRGDMHYIKIGQRTSIQDNSVLHITHAGDYHPGGAPLEIGDDVTIGHRVILHGCQVLSRVIVGMGSILLDDVVVEPDVIIGAGSLVPSHKTLESGYLWLGSPAIKKRPLTTQEKEFIRYSAHNYVKLKENYRQG